MNRPAHLRYSPKWADIYVRDVARPLLAVMGSNVWAPYSTRLGEVPGSHRGNQSGCVLTWRYP